MWNMKKPASEKDAAPAQASTHEEQQTPYGGSISSVPVKTAPHILVCGPTGRGKTTRVLAPGAILWQGPRVIVSSKTDFLMWLIKKGQMHERGQVYVMDLAGELDASFDWLQGVDYTMVTSDPTALISNDDDALAMASLLMSVGSLGASSGKSGGGDNAAFWQTLTVQSLAALLQAGQASGGGIDWALRAASRATGDGDDDMRPSWTTAHELIKGQSVHAGDLRSKGGLDAKMKDSIMATMQTALAPWLLSNVSGRGSEATPFSPKMLEADDEPTLAIIAPADGVAAGAAVAVVETIIRHWRRGIERGLERVLLSIDEAVNTCPIPKLPTYITEARGLGVACVVAVQSSSQMVLRWGEDGAKVLREVFPAHMILEGAPERELLENAAWWDGEEDVLRATIDSKQQKSLSAERVARTTATSLLPKDDNEGRLLLYGKKGLLVELPGVWDF